MAQVSVFSPWKDASRQIAGSDLSVLYYAKAVGDLGAAGTELDQATIQSAAAASTFRYAEGGGALAVDTDIDSYTGATGAGAAGTVTYADGNANSVQETINIINGVGVGSTAQRRWRAALGDFRPGFVLTATIGMVVAQANALLGRNSAGLSILADTSGLTAGVNTDGIFLGIGTDRGCIEGSGARWPDYFEDIPGSSTTASVNTPVRSPSRVPRKAEDATTRHLQYRITGFAAGFFHAAATSFRVWDINDNLIWAEPLANAITVFNDRSDNPIVGPVGSPLFCSIGGTGGETDGNFLVQAEVRAV